MTVIDNTRTVRRDQPPALLSETDFRGSVRSSGPALISTGVASLGNSPGPGAKERILATANELFYYEGIRAIGVDRLISDSCVTKATFYKHFGAKESLVVSYVQARHAVARDHLSALTAAAPNPQSAVRAMVDAIVDDVRDRKFRGCAFINAAIEFPEPQHPVREVVSSHRDWYTAFVADLFRQLGHPMPGDAADEFVLLRDGTMAGGYASDPIAASAALQRCVKLLLVESTTPPQR